MTGGAQGIGKAIARRLSEAGAMVVVGDLDDARAAQTAEALALETGGAVHGTHLDVRDARDVRRRQRRAVRGGE